MGTLGLSFRPRQYKCLPKAEFFCLFWLLKNTSAFLSFHNNIIAYNCWQKISDLIGFERVPSASLTFHNSISACSRHKIFGLFCFERALSASISVHNNTSACRRQKIFGFLAMKGHQLTRFILIKQIPIRIFLGGVGPILGGGVYFPSRGRVALRASRVGIPPSPPPIGLL